MNAQTAMMDSIGSKIEIEGTIEELQRISIFLENNFIKYAVVDHGNNDTVLDEWEEAIDWPLDLLTDIIE